MPDALASAAKQLVDKGWQRGVPWAYEVHPPANVDCTIGVPDNTSTIGEWLKRGFVPAYGRTLSPAERGQPLRCCSRPGSTGRRSSPPKIISPSRNIISPTSTCCSSAISPTRSPIPRPFETPWGKVAQLPTADLDRMQQILTARGYYHDKIDGKAGMLTRSALGAYQKRNGLKLDCWPTAAVLQQMQAGKATAASADSSISPLEECRS